jgi:hypothetical protein
MDLRTIREFAALVRPRLAETPSVGGADAAGDRQDRAGRHRDLGLTIISDTARIRQSVAVSFARSQHQGEISWQ